MVRRRGFTIIELLVVIGVMALLLGIAFPAYVGIRKSQKKKRTRQVVQTLAMAAASYANDYGMYPPAEYESGGPNWGNRSLVTLLDARGGRSWPYLPSAFYDTEQHIKTTVLLDEWDRPFIYFDSSAMKDDTSHTYTIEGNPAVSPIQASAAARSGRAAPTSAMTAGSISTPRRWTTWPTSRSGPPANRDPEACAIGNRQSAIGNRSAASRWSSCW